MSAAAGRTLIALVAVATAVVWLLLGELPWPARAYTTFLLAPLPALLLLQARLVRQIPEDAEREAIYISSAASVWILAGLAMLAARFGGITRLELRAVSLPPGPLLTAAALTTAAGLAIMGAGRLLRVRESALVDYLIPESTPEKIAYTGLSVTAGIGEELVFRSFLIAALLTATGSLAAAVAISVAIFALAHAYQGVAGTIRVALLGLVLTAPFLLTGSVYPSMIAHTVLDLIAGLALADWLRGADGPA
ncbi:MAG: CPBP family intramembrane metalloprotease [Gemmatimonadetes bacterium]|nr:CPBP family intramembrane metalloprotease [Gemmatimonadota bacterium]NIQ54307.1 CPBP family intramembrane metalloprotease [Gemmatimonadota bacterium]NIU74517.1 CPBP family intramembrane metalloprotease [Gammaproteobacteria bacterium]NIX44467.1 CPBP family intramembrane metalloprotease [Gemmatimonadota bacterium]NIY08689.1 CPBP family intramembrane metalloprotease [Gemmatimonadota bacterium]